MNAIFLALALIGVTNALMCYQGQQNASLPVQNSPMECLANSMSCILTFDEESNTVTRACQISNCTRNGVITNDPVCVNVTSNVASRSITTYCCCYSDGCNEELETMTSPSKSPADTNLAGSIAHRIEEFYDRDAVSAERTFIRRVVNHVYEHIDRENENDG
ncbi:Protein F58B4.6 [Aphelenchoides avenae]|nr:Protein F58B4.6 [Aphelenchus avenae]